MGISSSPGLRDDHCGHDSKSKPRVVVDLVVVGRNQLWQVQQLHQRRGMSRNQPRTSGNSCITPRKVDIFGRCLRLSHPEAGVLEGNLAVPTVSPRWWCLVSWVKELMLLKDATLGRFQAPDAKAFTKTCDLLPIATSFFNSFGRFRNNPNVAKVKVTT